MVWKENRQIVSGACCLRRVDNKLFLNLMIGAVIECNKLQMKICIFGND